jgi:hypothetical protein
MRAGMALAASASAACARAGEPARELPTLAPMLEPIRRPSSISQ